MRLGTHVAAGVLGYGLTAVFFELPYTAAGVVTAAAAAALPDVDTLGSTVGRVFSPIARRIERRWGHRTATHSYLAQAAVAALALPCLWLGGGAYAHLFAAAVVGYWSHPFLDTWTVQGVRLLWPWSDRRCVFPFYNRQPTRYRTRTGSKADAFFGVAFTLLVVPVSVLQVDGYQRLVRRVQADASAAVRDFLDMSAEGHLVACDVRAADPQNVRRLDGRFDAVGTTGQNTLLVRDPATGQAYSLGAAYTANFQPEHALCHRGPAVQVSRRRVALGGHVLADLENYVPRTPSGDAPGEGGSRHTRHLLDGTLVLDEPAELTPDPFGFDTVSGSGRRVDLRFATLADLERLGLTGRLVESGTVTVRVYTPAGAAEAYDPDATLRAGEVRHLVFAHARQDAARLLITDGDTVAAGDTVAVVGTAAVADADADLRDAAEEAAEVAAERLPASYDPLAARRRVREAREDLRRTAARHAEGFAPASALADARADLADAEGALAQAEARTAEWEAGRRTRRRAAESRLRRAESRLREVSASAHVTATALPEGARAVVRRTERRPLGPDRVEHRIVLVELDAARDAEPPPSSPPVPPAPAPPPAEAEP